MLKRLTLLLIAITLGLCAAAAAEAAPADFPLMASQSPMQLSDLVLDSSVLFPEGSADILPAYFNVSAVETDDEAIYLVLSYDKSVGELAASMSVRIDGYITETVEGALAQAPSGQEAVRFGVKNAPSVVASGYTLSLTNEDGSSVATVKYSSGLLVTGQTLEIRAEPMRTVFEINAARQLKRYVLDVGGGSIDATYDGGNDPESVLVTMDSPERVYYYEGSALSTIRDDALGIVAYYDADTGMMMHYTVSSQPEDIRGIQRVTFSPYGDVIEIAYPYQAEDWAMSYVFWSPNFGWHLADEENLENIFDLDAAALPDPAGLVPPLPVMEKPAYRTDIRSVADLPTLPLHVRDLPEVLDLQVEDGLATVTLSGELTLPGAIPSIRDRWNPDDDVTIASPAGPEGVYSARVGERVQAEDLCFDIFLPAKSLSEFSYGYAYDPLTKSWQVTVSSPAAEFVVDCTPAGKPVTAELVDFLAGETDHASLTFDEETGALTSYDYFLELPFVHRGGWYTFTYVPERGIVSAVCGDRSTGRFVWTPEDGWIDLVLGSAPDDLFDPLSFPFPFPFPAD